jgi:hypothetical protein
MMLVPDVGVIVLAAGDEKPFVLLVTGVAAICAAEKRWTQMDPRRLVRRRRADRHRAGRADHRRGVDRAPLVEAARRER